MKAVYNGTMHFFTLPWFFRRPEPVIKIGSFGMMNNPTYRQEAWREGIAQRLDCFDVVCLVCGHEPDIAMLADAFPEAWQTGKLKAVYKPWPFPEWSYEELPRHLNAALALAREQGFQWMMKLDIDTVVHEKDVKRLRKVVARATKKDRWVISLPKLQFFTPFRCWSKGNLPLLVNVTKPIAYGFDHTKYTDLCQPIIWDGASTVTHNGKTYDIPSGTLIPEIHMYKTKKVKVFNYDFTFRTYERSIELLYQIEMAHARFWGKGYSQVPLGEITRETAMKDFLGLSEGRFSRMNRKTQIEDHPKHFQGVLKGITAGQWGHSLWEKVAR